MENTKQKIQELVETLTLSDPIKSVVGDFIKKYEGEYTGELSSLIFALLLLDTTNSKNKTKANVLDEIMKENKESLDKLDNIDEYVTKLSQLSSLPTVG